MSTLFEQFKTNKKSEQDGIWLEYGTTNDGRPIRIKIARAGGSNIKFQKALEARLRPHRRQIQTDTLDEKTAERVFMDVFAEHIVLAWENVEGEDGVALEFNKDNVFKLFEQLPDLFADIRDQANKSSLFRDALRETDAKNS